MRISVILFSVLLCEVSQGQRSLFPLNLLPNTTVRIEGFRDTIVSGVKKNIASTGTAFFFEFKIDTSYFLVLVSNRHVVEHCARGRLSLKLSTSATLFNAPIKSDTLVIQNFSKQWIFHPSEDLAILPFEPLKKRFAKKYRLEPSFGMFDQSIIPTLADSLKVTSIEKVFMIGYPKSLWDSANNLPLVRQGLTATPYFSDYNGQKRFLIDIPVFPGSSGSPVVLYSTEPVFSDSLSIGDVWRVRLLGIATESLLYNEDGKLAPYSQIPSNDSLEMKYKLSIKLPLNIAVAVKAERLFDFIPLIRNYIVKQKNL